MLRIIDFHRKKWTNTYAKISNTYKLVATLSNKRVIVYFESEYFVFTCIVFINGWLVELLVIIY